MLGVTTIASALAANESRLKTTFAILAIALPALSTAIVGYGALYAFEQQQKLYLDAVRALHNARAVGAADPAAYVQTVEEIFEREQAQWGQIIGEIKPTTASVPSP